MWYAIIGGISLFTILVVFILIYRKTIQNLISLKIKHEMAEEKLRIALEAANKQLFGELKKNEALETLLLQQESRLEDKLKQHEKQVQQRLDTQRVVLKGRIAERLIKLSKNLPYNPADLFPQAPPFDWLILDGYSDQRNEFSIIFAEIKTGDAKINMNERKIKKAIEEGRVQYKVLRAEAHVEVEEE